MISRRTLVLSLLATSFTPSSCLSTLARQNKIKIEPVIGGPRTLSKQEWPPAITPEFVSIVDKGFVCFADDLGRLAIVDLKQEENPLVLGEIFSIGRKVICLAITQYKAFAVVQVDNGSQIEYQLVTIGLTPANDISIFSKVTLSNFSEPTCISAFAETVAIGGIGLDNEKQVVLLGTNKRKSDEYSNLSTMTLEKSPFKLDLQQDKLVILAGQDNTELHLVSLSNPRSPASLGHLKLEGSYSVLARNKDQILLAGQGFDKRFRLNLLGMRPQLKVLNSIVMNGVSDVIDIASQKTQYLLLVNQGQRQAVVPISIVKRNELQLGNAVLLPPGSKAASPRAHIAAKDKDAYIASDWGAMQVLNVSKTGWQFSYSHTIPRLPASSVVVSGNKALLACAELKSYDISDPRHPIISASIDLNSLIKDMVLVDKSILCLSRQELTLRNVDRLANKINISISNGTSLSYDSELGMAYVLSNLEPNTKLFSYKIENNSINLSESEILPISGRKIKADKSKILIAALSEFNLFKIENSKAVLFGTRKIPNFAIRDFILKDETIYALCVDENLQGYLLILSCQKAELSVLSSLSLPVDATSLALSTDLVVVVGKDKRGKDKACLVSISNLTQPKLLENFSVIDSASALGVQNNKAVIVGRGLEIISLS